LTSDPRSGAHDPFKLVALRKIIKRAVVSSCKEETGLLMEKTAAQARMDPERLERTIRFANQLARKDCPLPLLRRGDGGTQYSDLTESVEYLLLESHRRRKLILPELRAFNNQSIGVFSDYSGEGRGRYAVYSVLVCGFNMRTSFEQHAREARARVGLGDKEIAYKDLRMGQMRRALPDFLAAADELPGFLCTVAVDKRIRSVFGSEKDTPEKLVAVLEEAGLGRRKPAVAEKLLRVVHLAAYLTALLGEEGQKVFWMTDHDEICPTSEEHRKLLEIFARVLPLYQKQGAQFGQMGGAVPFPARSVEMNDLLSLADLAAGAICDYLSKRDSTQPDDIRVKAGVDSVMLWLARAGIGLKKFCCLLRKREDQVIERATVEFTPISSQTGIFIPIYD